MSTDDLGHDTVLVISDDDELGALLALNLRRRHLAVEQTDFRLATSPRWSPACIRPCVVVISAERSNTDPLAFLRSNREQVWLSDASIILASENAERMVARLGNPKGMIATELDDLRAIVAATLAHVPHHPEVPHPDTSSPTERTT